MNKEFYFTPENLREKAGWLLSDLESLRQRHYDQNLHISRSALLVLDMQAYFLDPDSHAFVPSALAILPGIRALIHAFQLRGMPVIFTRHSNTPQNAGMMSRWWKDIILPGSECSKIYSGLDTRGGKLLDKNQYDAFKDTTLNNILAAQEIGQVVVTGVMTNLCCESTARSAFMHNYEVIFTIDGTATYTEAYHRAALLNLSHGFAVPVLVDEVLDACRA